MFKYKFSAELSEILGELMAKQLGKFMRFANADEIYLVPVPLHKARLKYRGFNQALLLAEYLSKQFSSVRVLNCLSRMPHLERQAKLGKLERQTNLLGAFYLDEQFPRSEIYGQSFILIDDISTTCSTLNECAKILKNNGARTVTGLVLARGHLFC